MLYPLMMHALMYDLLMENKTSEQAARILAMQMANDNAVKLLGKLQLEYNKLRQQGITSELLDIAGAVIGKVKPLKCYYIGCKKYQHLGIAGFVCY